MYRRGVVSAVDPDTHRVRVKFPSKGDVESSWLDVPVDDALDDQQYGLPSLGAQVSVILDEREEEGCVIGAIYSKADVPIGTKNTDVRRWTFKDGAVFEYDRESNTWTVDVPDGGAINIKVGGNATIEATGDVHVKPGGLLKVDGAADFVALAAKCDARFDALELDAATHIHPTGVGPSGPEIVPLTPGESVKCTKTKTT